MSMNGQIGTMQYKTITPNEAAGMIERSAGVGNRRVSIQQAEAMAADMKHGRWRGGDSVMVVRADGLLLDGGNRCFACVMADTPIGTWVRTVSVDTDVHDLRVDVGRKRQAGFILRVDHANVAVARFYLRLVTHVTQHSVDAIKDVLPKIKPQLDMLSNTRVRGVTAAHRAATAFSMWRYPGDDEAIAAQYHAIVTLDFAKMWPTVVSAMQPSLIGAGSSGGGSGDQYDQFARLTRAFEPERRGNSRIALKGTGLEVSRSYERLVSKYIGVPVGK